MRIAHFGNMANDAYLIVKALQQRGVDCDLYVDIPQHVASYPQWEDNSIDVKDIGNDMKPTWETLNQHFTSPEWLKFIDINRGAKFRPPSIIGELPFFPDWKVFWIYRYAMRRIVRGFRLKLNQKISDLMMDYDLVVPHVPYSCYAMTIGKPYIPFDAGLIRNFQVYDKLSYQEMRFDLLEESYRKAPLIFATNIDTFSMFRRLGIHNIMFMPFLIDTDRYKPSQRTMNLPYEYVVFHPTRQTWNVKGNYMLIKAFAKFVKEHVDSLLILVNWGIDFEKARKLVHKLGISKHVRWIGLLCKPALIRWYNEATVVADQFILKGAGTTVNEAMACGKPVIISLAPKCALEAYGEVPPTLYCDGEDSIFEQLMACTDHDLCRKIGDAGRVWELKHHNPDVVSKLHIDAYEKVVAS